MIPRQYRKEPLAPRHLVTYHCPAGHEQMVPFLAGVTVPVSFACRCGAEGHRDGAEGDDTARETARDEHMARVRQRRSQADLEALLADALDRAPSRRPEGS